MKVSVVGHQGGRADSSQDSKELKQLIPKQWETWELGGCWPDWGTVKCEVCLSKHHGQQRVDSGEARRRFISTRFGSRYWFKLGESDTVICKHSTVWKKFPAGN